MRQVGSRTRFAALCTSLLAGCSGGGGDGGSTPPPTPVTPPAAPTLTLALNMVKVFDFSWQVVTGATSYKLLEDPDGSSGYSPIAAASSLTGSSYQHVAPLYKRFNARYILQACNSAGCTDSAPVSVTGNLAAAVGYGKASNPAPVDQFGWSLALSGDGMTLAVGAVGEDGSSLGIGGNQADNAAADSGAVYVFARNGGSWTQQAYIKASNAAAGDQFGYAVALSTDGNTLAVGARDEDSSATGIGGNQNDNSATDSGAVYLFARSSGVWTQQAYVKASNTGPSDVFGNDVALSGDGNTLAVGARDEDSNASGVGGNQNNNLAGDSGAAYLFVRAAGSWSQQAYIKASNAEAHDAFGTSVALSRDGDTLAVGALYEDSNARGVGFDQANNAALRSGAVYVFAQSASGWEQQAYIKASNTDAEDNFGAAVALDADGDTLAVGAPNESSDARLIDGNQGSNSLAGSGAVYVFARAGSGNVWSQQAYVKASYTGTTFQFGSSVALDATGDTLAVGVPRESGAGHGINSIETDGSIGSCGAVNVYARGTGSFWSWESRAKAPNTGVDDYLGMDIALAADGDTLAAAAPFESSLAAGFGGNQDDDSGSYAGAVYVY